MCCRASWFRSLTCARTPRRKLHQPGTAASRLALPLPLLLLLRYALICALELPRRPRKNMTLLTPWGCRANMRNLSLVCLPPLRAHRTTIFQNLIWALPARPHENRRPPRWWPLIIHNSIMASVCPSGRHGGKLFTRTLFFPVCPLLSARSRGKYSCQLLRFPFVSPACAGRHCLVNAGGSSPSSPLVQGDDNQAQSGGPGPSYPPDQGDISNFRRPFPSILSARAGENINDKVDRPGLSLTPVWGQYCCEI